MQSGLVIIGEEEMDDYGDSVVPLFTAFPQREPILAEGGGRGQRVEQLASQRQRWPGSAMDGQLGS